MGDFVRIYEVGPRDGLQNEPKLVPTPQKINLINLLSEVGFERIEIASFVSPKWVPQMGDAAEVVNGITRSPGTRYAALTPNVVGYENAKVNGVDEVAIFGSASETFSEKNINCSIAESLARFSKVAKMAERDGIPMRGYVSCVVGCPYEGTISPVGVADIALRLLDLGCYEISLGDTIGCGTPEKVSSMLDQVLKHIPAESLAGHFHDTNGSALDNAGASLSLGLRTFDSAIGGLGGCPYAPGAKGNLSTALLNDFLIENGYRTGLRRDKLLLSETFVQDEIAKPEMDEGR